MHLCKSLFQWIFLGEVPFPGFAAYGASKAAVLSYYGALRQELSRWGIKVVIVQPGGFKTSKYSTRYCYTVCIRFTP